MSREAFYNLLKRYLEGKCTEEEKKVVEQWYNMLDDEDLPDIHQADLDVLAERAWNVINAGTPVPEQVPLQKAHTFRQYWFTGLSIAAGMAGLVFLSTYLFRPGAGPDEFTKAPQESLVQNTNNTSEPMTVLLADGSNVVLQPHAELTYTEQFGKTHREVYIRGEALFEVHKDEEHPFYVFSRELVTKVVGTTFIVRANEDTDESEVVVVTGKVIVTKNESGKGYRKILPSKSQAITLTPNQMVVYHKEKVLTATLVPNPSATTPEDEHKDFLYSDTPLPVVIRELETTYGIEIITPDNTLDQCTFTGDLTDQGLYDMLEFIVQSVGATYRIDGVKIRIEGGTCGQSQ